MTDTKCITLFRQDLKTAFRHKDNARVCACTVSLTVYLKHEVGIKTGSLLIIALINAVSLSSLLQDILLNVPFYESVSDSSEDTRLKQIVPLSPWCGDHRTVCVLVPQTQDQCSTRNAGS